MYTKPFISILTPSFNQGNFLKENIESVLSQYFQSWEHIVIDNCSTDQTNNILNNYSYLLKIIESDSGQAEALNKGIVQAKGKWILWLNADDYLLPDTLLNYIKAIQRFPSHDIFYGHVQLVNKEGIKLKIVYHLPYSQSLLFWGVYCPPSTGTLFKANLLKNSLFDRQFHYVMDTEWYHRNKNRINPKCIGIPTVCFRVSDSNKTSANILTGKIGPQHEKERQENRNKYVYPSLKNKFIKEEVIYLLGNKLFTVVYYFLKSKHLVEIARDRFQSILHRYTFHDLFCFLV